LAHGFYVNVGVFAVAQNANTVRGKLDGTGYPIVADTVKSKDAQATRIRVGPFAKRAQAQAAAKKIHALKLDAVVVRH
jgi:cell division septation protein DedD